MLFAIIMWGVYRNAKQDYELYKLKKQCRQFVMEKEMEEIKYAGFHA